MDYLTVCRLRVFFLKHDHLSPYHSRPASLYGQSPKTTTVLHNWGCRVCWKPWGFLLPGYSIHTRWLIGSSWLRISLSQAVLILLKCLSLLVQMPVLLLLSWSHLECLSECGCP